jgi:phosphoribosylformylglycinamidine (FGAM) synthase-like enzyme
MGGSEYYEYFHNITGGVVPNVNLASEKLNANAMLKLIRNNLVGCVHDCSKGGLGVALAEIAIKGEIGITIDLNHVPNSCSRLDNLIFSESHSRFIFSTSQPAEVIRMLSKFEGLGFAKIGNADKRNENVIFRNKGGASGAEVTVVVDTSLEKLRKSTNAIQEILNK